MEIFKDRLQDYLDTPVTRHSGNFTINFFLPSYFVKFFYENGLGWEMKIGFVEDFKKHSILVLFVFRLHFTFW